MRLTIVVVVVTQLLLGCSTPRVLHDKAIAHFQQGVIAFEAGLYIKANDEFSRAIKFHPQDELLWAGESEQHQLEQCARSCVIRTETTGDFLVDYAPNRYLDMLDEISFARESVSMPLSLVDVELSLTLVEQVADGRFEAGEFGNLIVSATNHSNELIDGYMVEVSSDRRFFHADHSILSFGVLRAGEQRTKSVRLFSDSSAQTGMVQLQLKAHDAFGRLAGDKEVLLDISTHRYERPTLHLKRQLVERTVRANIRNSAFYLLCNRGRASAFNVSLSIEGNGIRPKSAVFIPSHIELLPTGESQNCREIELLFTPNAQLTSGDLVQSTITISDQNGTLFSQDGELYLEQNPLEDSRLMLSL